LILSLTPTSTPYLTPISIRRFYKPFYSSPAAPIPFKSSQRI
jgi:hypothetical protein